MHTQSFTHVCKECHSPVMMPLSKWRFLLVGIVQAILSIAFIVWLGWIGIGLVIVWILVDGINHRKCPQCGARALIPVQTPVGLKIMEDEGWTGHEVSG